MTSLKNRIDAAAQSVLTGKASIRTALLSKEVEVPENPSFQQLANGVNSIIPGAKLNLTNYKVEPIDVCATIYQSNDLKKWEYLQRSDRKTIYIGDSNKLNYFDTELYTSTLLGDLPTMSNTRKYCGSKNNDKLFWVADSNLYVVDSYTLALTTFEVEFPAIYNSNSRSNAIIGYEDSTNKFYYGCPGYNHLNYSRYLGVYDLNNSTLTALSDCPTYFGACGFNNKIIGGKLYVFFANLSGTTTPPGSIYPYAYSTQNATWSRISDLPAGLISSTGNPDYALAVRYQNFVEDEDSIYFVIDSRPEGISNDNPRFNLLKYSISQNTFEKIYPSVYLAYRWGNIVTNKNSETGTPKDMVCLSTNRTGVKVFFDKVLEIRKLYNGIRFLPVNSKLATYNLNVPCADEQNMYPSNTNFTPISDVVKIMSDVSTVSGTITLTSGNV